MGYHYIRIPIRAAALLLLLASAAIAEDVVHPAPDDRVSPEAHVTYLDLLRRIVPDLAKSDSGYVGRFSAPVAHIAGPGFGGDPPEPAVMRAVSALKTRAGGVERILLLADFGQPPDRAESMSVLALYRLGGELFLLDAVEVGFDRHTSFADEAKLPIGSGDDAFITVSTHSNSHQSYVTTALMFVRDDRIRLIDRFFTFGEQACAFSRAQDVRFEALSARSSADFASILAEISDHITPGREDCEETDRPPPSSRTVSAIYSWDEQGRGFIGDRSAFDRMEQESRERF